MTKKRSRDRKRKGGNLDHFADAHSAWRMLTSTDFAWLEAEFQQQAERNPHLTLEGFAVRQGVHPESIRRFSDTGTDFITVWHGTTADSARMIMVEGFSTLGKPQKKIWFTRKPGEAHGYAKRRSAQRGETPVVFKCVINLAEYSNFERPSPDHYVFRHRLSKDVIQNVSNLRYRIQPDLIRRFEMPKFNRSGAQVPANHAVLWYGTTADRAKVIMKEGFRIKDKSDEAILFTRKSREAHSIAKRESKRNGEVPVVFRCEVDLVKYAGFERPKPRHYVFRYSHITKDVIRTVIGLEADIQSLRKENESESMDIDRRRPRPLLPRR